VKLLDVRDLHVEFPTADGVVGAVRGLSFVVDRTQTLAIVGESGAGKSVAVQALIGLTAPARVSGEACFEGHDLLTMDDRALRRIRGAEIAMIFQNSLSALHPAYSVGWQIVEMIRSHDRQVSRRHARAQAIDLLRLVGIGQADRRVDEHPHQYSGGMRQRAMIAMAMALNPKLLIADEPTTGLDVIVQAQVLDVFGRLREEFGTAVVIVTHDLRVVAEIADVVVVMYAGTTMEAADRRDLFAGHHHPYTSGLLASMPGVTSGRLTPIPGQPPSAIDVPRGCPFHPRCGHAFDACLTRPPPLVEVASGHRSACWLSADPTRQSGGPRPGFDVPQP
jgi:peptide/nickel transport system ATP-binding protein